MNVQLALDRLTIEEAIKMGNMVREYVDWIEVGTSLIKEFGMESVKELRKAFPEKIIVADIKTFDNARYEFEMCYKAGADVATVMGAAPKVSIDTCMKVAQEFGKLVMFDLLNASTIQVEQLLEHEDAIFCGHVSKDQQEISGEKQSLNKLNLPQCLLSGEGGRLALAGGITLESLPNLAEIKPYVVIVGSGITKAKNPSEAAKEFKQLISKLTGGK
ncbi:MAG TPA: 3-hexulose-6-phosphate synthase [Clostridium sp.]